MNTEREKVLEKLKKLFALGQSSNQHEAELAMKKASEIMEEYQIGMSEVDMAAEGKLRTEEYEVRDAGGSRHWVYVLTRCAAKLFDGESVHVVKNGKMIVSFVGTPTDVAAMKMTFEHLWKSWQSIVEADLRAAKTDLWQSCRETFTPADTMKYKHGHGVGYSSALWSRVVEIAKRRHASVAASSVTGQSLVVVKGQAVKQYMAENTQTKRNSSSAGSHSGQIAGRAAGDKVPLGGIEKRSTHMIGAA